jgi:hypothetical protein
LTTIDILEGSQAKLEKLRLNQLPVEDVLWALAGAINHLREIRLAGSEIMSEADLQTLARILQFIGHTRADMAMSFFYLLLKDCGLFTIIPKALKQINDQKESGYLLSRFEALLRPESGV